MNYSPYDWLDSELLSQGLYIRKQKDPMFFIKKKKKRPLPYTVNVAFMNVKVESLLQWSPSIETCF